MNLTRLPDVFNLDPIEEGLRSLMRPWRFDLEASAPQMRLDIQEQDGAYEVTAEMPGVKKEDIDVRIDGRQVNLSAQIKRESHLEESSKAGARMLREERHYGYLNRSFNLACDIDEGRAKARYENGLLALTLPKKASAEARRLSIS